MLRPPSALRVLAPATFLVGCVVGCARIAGLGEGTAPAGEVASGDGGSTDPSMEIGPASFDFGASACGVDSSAKLLNIHNRGDGPAAYKVLLPAGSAFHIDGALEGAVGAGATVTLQLFAKPVLAGANASDIVVTAGSAFQTIQATVTGNGPTMELAPPVLAFGDVRRQNGGGPTNVEVSNNGTETLAVTSFVSSDPNFAAPGSLTVAAGQKGSFAVTFASALNDDATAVAATLTPVVAKLCGAPPVLQVSGRRVTSDVTVTGADWGKQSCNTTPGPKTIVISNYVEGTPVGFEIIDPLPTAFTFAPLKGTIQPGTGTAPTTAAITVTPNKLPGVAPLPNITETLRLQLTGGITTTRDAELHVETRGSILAYTPAALAFAGDGAQNFQFSNTGNEQIALTFVIQRQGGGNGPWEVAPSSVVPTFLNGGQTLNGKVTFRSQGPGAVAAGAAPFIFSSGTACSPFSALPLTGMRP